MKELVIPKFFHEVLGERSTVLEVILILLTGMFVTLMIFSSSFAVLKEEALWKSIIILLLTFDIAAGVIANFTYSTNMFYKKSSRLRAVFLIIHIQPLLFSWLLGGHYLLGISVWIYTQIAGWVVNLLLTHPAQRTIAGVFIASGISGAILLGNNKPAYLLIILLLYMIKVIYSFSVDHYAIRGM